jgi:hypothetical protein
MSYRTLTRSGNLLSSRRRLAAESLKCCPLCGAVNARLNGECFVCRWSGAFDHDPARIEQGVSDLLIRCPELAEAILYPSTPPPQPLIARLAESFGRFFRRRVDLRA